MTETEEAFYSEAMDVEVDEWDMGYDCQFVSEPPEDLLCLICTFVAKDPQQVTCCGRVYCLGCIGKQREESPKCPNCSRMISYFPDSRSKRHIQSLRVRCYSCGLGCVWEGELRNLTAHEKQCTFVRVECPNKCSEVVLRKDLGQHTNASCPRRRYKCPYCHQFGTYRAITSVHVQECPEVVVACPNRCGVPNVARGRLAAHKETCPNEEVSCRYGEVGCNSWLPRKLMLQHENESQAQHLQLSMQTVSTLKRTVNKMKTFLQLKPPIACFKVANFHELRSSETDWTSPPFYSHPGGYKLCLNVEPNGFETGKGTHISVFIYVMKGKNDKSLPWPCKAHVTVELLNQLHDEAHRRCTIDLENEEASRVGEGVSTGNGYGPHTFVPLDELTCNAMTNTHFLKGDCLYFQVRVACDTVYRPWLEEI